MDRPLVVIDTEHATRYGPPHLVEVAAVRLVDGEIEDTLETLVRPQVPIDPETTAVHGIGDLDVADAPEAGVVLEHLDRFVGEDWLVAHGAAADARVLGFEYERCGRVPPGAPWIDTLKLARALLSELPDHKLDTLAAALELEEVGAHRALVDAVRCCKVLEACAERMQDGAGAAALLAKCGPPLTVADQAPRLLRKPKPRHRALVRACGGPESRREVRLVYGSGDQDPATLRVRPHFLYTAGDRDYLEAECLHSGLWKTYRLDRIRRVLAG